MLPVRSASLSLVFFLFLVEDSPLFKRGRAPHTWLFFCSSCLSTRLSTLGVPPDLPVCLSIWRDLWGLQKSVELLCSSLRPLLPYSVAKNEALFSLALQTFNSFHGLRAHRALSSFLFFLLRLRRTLYQALKPSPPPPSSSSSFALADGKKNT